MPGRRHAPDRRRAASALRFEALMDVVMLIVTELLTNALLHSGSTEISLRISVEDGCLRIAVRDGMPGSAEPRAATDTAESGRGLMIVEALAAEHSGTWGTDGTETWCCLALLGGEEP
uniref:ATP-binding protein n=1 Tax=Streptomyces sp. NBC_00180 TaxID=2903632 RepID=A0AAU1IDF8_9ACTN